MKNIRNIIRESINKVLSESMSMMVDDHGYEHDLDGILDICHYVISMVANDLYPKLKLSNEEKQAIGGIGDTFTPDGRDAFEPVGTMNFYTAGWPAHVIEKTVSYIKYILGEKNIQVGDIKYEKVKDKLSPEELTDYGIEDGGESLRVIRFPIVKNEAAGNSGNPPQVNLSNTNAQKLFGDVLGFEGSDGFSMSTADLLMKISSARKQMAARSDIPDKSYDTQDGMMYNTVNGKDYYTRIFDVVENFALWANKHGYNRINVA